MAVFVTRILSVHVSVKGEQTVVEHGHARLRSKIGFTNLFISFVWTVGILFLLYVPSKYRFSKSAR